MTLFYHSCQAKLQTAHQLIHTLTHTPSIHRNPADFTTHTHTHANTPASRHLLPAVPPQCKSAALRATSSQLLKYIVCVVLLGIIQIFFFFTTSTPYRGGCSSAALRHTESFFFSFHFELLLFFVSFLYLNHTRVFVSPSICYFWDVLRYQITLWCSFLAIFVQIIRLSTLLAGKLPLHFTFWGHLADAFVLSGS